MKNKSLIIVVAMILIAVFAGSIFFDSFYEKTTPVSFYPPKRGGEDPVNNKEDINKPIIAEEKAEYISWGRNEPTEEDFIASFNEAIAKGEIVFDDFGGFGEFGKKVHSGNPQTTISTSDLPPELAKQLNDELKFKEKHGYERATDDDVYREKSALFELSGKERNIPYLSFELSKIPEFLESFYDYQGYIYPISMITVPSYPSVKRVYKSKSGVDYIVINEETLKHGSSHVISEFVNASVQGCPAIIGEKRALSGDGYGAINWSNKNYSYTIMRLYAPDHRTQGLLELANQLAIANQSTHVCSEAKDEDEKVTDQNL